MDRESTATFTGLNPAPLAGIEDRVEHIPIVSLIVPSINRNSRL